MDRKTRLLTLLLQVAAGAEEADESVAQDLRVAENVYDERTSDGVAFWQCQLMGVTADTEDDTVLSEEGDAIDHTDSDASQESQDDESEDDDSEDDEEATHGLVDHVCLLFVRMGGWMLIW